MFNEYFTKHILPEKVDRLYVAFLVPEMRREFGGCAGNIAYNVHALGGSAAILAAVGDDFSPYRSRLQALGLNDSYLHTVAGSYTGQAFITTDLADNQITAFHPGAMNFSEATSVSQVPNVTLGIVAPAGKLGMQKHMQELADAGIPAMFDPGQAMPIFEGDELKTLIELASFVAVNDYEAALLSDKTGWDLPTIATKVKALIVTRGAAGAEIYADGQTIHINAVPATEIIDPTGCGDAFRAGLLYGIQAGWSWQKTGQLAALLGSLKIAHRGGQNHPANRELIANAYQAHFGAPLFS